MDVDALLVELSEQPFDVAFHPSRPLLCAGLITGHVDVIAYAAEVSRGRGRRGRGAGGAGTTGRC